MAAESKTEDVASKYKIEELYDMQKEKELLKLYVDIALAPSDKSWTKHNTKDSRLQVDYKYLPNDNLCTIRGQAVIPNSSPEQYYEFSEGGYNDVYEWEKQCDKMCTENVCVKAIDVDHEIVYGSYDSGIFVISPRDFCYMKARYKLTDYKGPDGKTYDVACTLCYSVDDKYPFHRSTKKKHVRAILKYSGYLFIRNKSDNNVPASDCRACYIVYLDPCGWIPTWVVNLVAPDQGMVIKAMLENWSSVQQKLDRRKENGYKRDNQMLFDKPQPFDGFDNDKNNEVESKDDEKEAKAKPAAGGWKKAEQEELDEVGNAIKDEVTKKAQDKGAKVTGFEVVSGLKQVVAGMKMKMKIKLGDEVYAQVQVFRSLPPVKYEVSNIEVTAPVEEEESGAAGGWKEAENAELFDAANAVKEAVEAQAAKDEQEAFKIFEVAGGTKQV